MLLHSPLPSVVDSAALAGLLDLFRTKGLWLASLRYGYFLGALRECEGGVLPLAKAGKLWSSKTLRKVSSLFESECAAFAKGTAKTEGGDFESANGAGVFDGECNGHGESTGDGDTEEACAGRGLAAHMKARLLPALMDMTEGLGLSDKISLGVSAESAVSRLIEKTIDGFLGNTLLVGAQQILAGAIGSFGLCFSHSLDASNEVVLAARGQTMSFAVYPVSLMGSSCCPVS